MQYIIIKIFETRTQMKTLRNSKTQISTRSHVITRKRKYSIINITANVANNKLNYSSTCMVEHSSEKSEHWGIPSHFNTKSTCSRFNKVHWKLLLEEGKVFVWTYFRLFISRVNMAVITLLYRCRDQSILISIGEGRGYNKSYCKQVHKIKLKI